MKNRIIRLLAIMGALLGARPAIQAAEKGDSLHAKAELGLYANEEFRFGSDTFADISLCPHLRLQKNEYVLDCEGSYWKQWVLDGSEGDWLALKQKITLENADYALVFGRDLTAGQMAGYKNVPATTGFANTVKGYGASRSLTGINLWNKEYGWQLGWMAKDAEFSLNHMNMAVVGYQKQLNNQWGVQFQVGGGQTALDYAGATIAYTPDKDNAFVADVLYKNDRVSGVLMAKHNLSDRLALFANAEVNQAKNAKVNALMEAGVSYDIGHGFKVVGAVQHAIGENREIRGVIGLQYFGNVGYER